MLGRFPQPGSSMFGSLPRRASLVLPNLLPSCAFPIAGLPIGKQYTSNGSGRDRRPRSTNPKNVQPRNRSHRRPFSPKPRDEVVSSQKPVIAGGQFDGKE